MTLILKQIFAFLKLLNSDTDTKPLAAGLSLGLLIGFAPFFSIQTIVFFIIVFFFRIQMGAAFLSAFFFKFVAYLLDGPADYLGQWVLEMHFLKPFFTYLYNMPIVPMTRFNNSIVMGSMCISLLLIVPMYFVFNRLILQYRETVVKKFQSTRFWKVFAASKFVNWYNTYSQLY